MATYNNFSKLFLQETSPCEALGIAAA